MSSARDQQGAQVQDHRACQRPNSGHPPSPRVWMPRGQPECRLGSYIYDRLERGQRQRPVGGGAGS